MPLRTQAIITSLVALAALAAPASWAVPARAASAPVRATGDAYQATITRAVRRVEWERANTSAWQPAFVHTLLMPGDTLRTGADAKAELLYGDGSLGRVGSLSSLTITGAGKRELHLNAGRVWLHIQKSGFGMKVITPGAVAAVTGTELMVEFDATRRLTQVTVFEGAVNVAGDVGNLVRVLGGTSTLVPFHAPAVQPMPLDKSKLQERENLFKPLAVPESKATSEPTDVASPEAKATPKPNATTGPDKGPAPDARVTPVAPPTPEAKATPGTPTTTPIGKAPAGDEKPVAPDLKAQAQQNNDPRLLNGSPTTGGVKVIIK